jgi:hypothetical protein
MALQPYIPEVISGGWLPIRELKKLLNGEGVVIESGYVQERIVKLWWVNESEALNLRNVLDLPQFLPVSEGWVYEIPPLPSPIIDTVKIYNIVVQGKRYGPQPR